nr:IDM1 [Camellia sinensis]
MLFNKEIEDLHDDGFEGSINESRIFTEVFFGNDCDTTSKRCLVTGVINFECDYSRHTDMLLCSNNEKSAITSQVGSCNVKEDSKKNSGKQMKLAVDELSYSRPNSRGILKSSALSKEVVSGMSASQSICHTIMGRLVESSGQGVTSSCYLLKHHAEINSGGEIGDRDVSNRRLESLDGSDEKEVNASKAIASPVSQESFASKLLVASPSVTVANNSGSHRCAEERTKASNSSELSMAKISLNRVSMKDPRPPLRNHIQNLLRAAGWQIRRRKREDNISGEFLYLSPWGGRPIRELRRVWNLCGRSLLADGNIVVREDSKLWTDMTHFWSDLSNTFIKIEEELNNTETTALARRWYLLDPFANMVLIDKKLGTLRAGKVVKARRTLVIDTSAKDDSVLALKNANGIGNQLERPSTYRLCYSSVASESALTVSEGIQCRDFSGNKRSRLDLSSLQAYGSDGTSDHFSSCLFEVPITSGNAHVMHGGHETVSRHHDCNTNSPSCARHRSDHGEEMVLEVKKNVSKGEEGKTFRGKFTEKVENQLKSFICSSQRRNGKKLSTFGKFHQNSGSAKKSNQFFSEELNFKNITVEVPLHVKNESLHPEAWRQDIKSEKAESQNGQKRSITCQLKDDDLLISAIIKNKTFGSTTKRSAWKCKSASLRKYKSQKGSCRLLPRSLGKGGKHIDGKWSMFGSRTVLSWLIDSGVVSLNEVIQYRNPKDESVVKDGLVNLNGILCKCCNKVLSLSEFKVHAGFKLNRPCLNLFMESGKSFTLCQLEAWSAEYKARKSATRTVQDDEMDENDDSCGLCGGGGELICCDNCPSTFHQACLHGQELPEGSWYCQHCTCRICGDLVKDKEPFKSPGAFKCSQCEHKYHEACLKEKGECREVASDTWFCRESCQEVYLGIHSRIGFVNLLPDGFSWTLLRYIHGDQRVHSAQRLVALKAECNSKLAVALTIMEECFLSMVDSRTGIDMIPHVLYNWGSHFARLNYIGFHTVVLEKDDVLMCVASIRIHGVTVAEMPLIATCSKYRRQGMCRRLMNAIEEMLRSFKVEKLVISAIPSLVETWTVGFGFKPLEDNERNILSNINLMVFPGTVWLKKPIYESQTTNQQSGSGHASPSIVYDPAETGACSQLRPAIGNSSVTETEHTGCNIMQVDEAQDGSLQKHFSKLSCEEPASTVGTSRLEMVCDVESVVMYDERELSSKQSCREPASTVGTSRLEMVCDVESVVMYDERELSANEQLQKTTMLQDNEK